MSKVFILGMSPLPFENDRKVYGTGIRTWQFALPLLKKGHEVCICNYAVPSAYPGDFKSQFLENFVYTDSSGYKFTALNVSLSRSSAGIFSNFELYKDVDDDMNSYDYGSAIATGSVSGNNVQFSSFNQSLTMGTTVYYFIVADVDFFNSAIAVIKLAIPFFSFIRWAPHPKTTLSGLIFISRFRGD